MHWTRSSEPSMDELNIILPLNFNDPNIVRSKMDSFNLAKHAHAFAKEVKFQLTCHVIVHCTAQHERVYSCRPWLSSSRRCSCTCRRCKAPGSFTTTCSSTSWGRRCPTSTRRRKDGQLNMNQSRLILKYLPSCQKVSSRIHIAVESHLSPLACRQNIFL